MTTVSKLSRREFLKAASSLSLTPLHEISTPLKTIRTEEDGRLPNIIILIFDALSAFHLTLYGYPRHTCPNFERFAQQATVFHNHHSTANFTTPSSASLFTSTYPWEHRAYTLRGLIKPSVVPQNVFRLLHGKYHCAAFSQNVNSDMLLYQFENSLDTHLPADSFTTLGKTIYNHFPSEEAISTMKSYDQLLIKPEGNRGSLFLSLLYELNYLLNYRIAARDLKEIHPKGLPSLPGSYVHFLLEEVMDGVISLVSELPSPFFSYIHLMPPHYPYIASKPFLGMFNDGWNPPPKKRHPLGNGPRTNYPNKRRDYDEFIANLDAEFGRLLDHMQESGLLDSSYLILTSDHGELFERGHRGHTTPMLFEPLIHVPLLISAPGQKTRKDIYSLTSIVDVMPTVLQIADVSIPESYSGQILPGLGGTEDPDREIWSLEAKINTNQGRLNRASLALLQGINKMVYYHGHKKYQNQYELYNLKEDPDELVNLYPSNQLAATLKNKVDNKFNIIQ